MKESSDHDGGQQAEKTGLELFQPRRGPVGRRVKWEDDREMNGIVLFDAHHELEGRGGRVGERDGDGGWEDGLMNGGVRGRRKMSEATVWAKRRGQQRRPGRQG